MNVSCDVVGLDSKQNSFAWDSEQYNLAWEIWVRTIIFYKYGRRFLKENMSREILFTKCSSGVKNKPGIIWEGAQRGIFLVHESIFFRGIRVW